MGMGILNGNGHTKWGMDRNIDGDTHTERLGIVWH